MNAISELRSDAGMLLRTFSRWVRNLPARGLDLQELTCLFAVVDPKDPALADALARQDARLDDEYEEAARAGAVSIPSYAVPGLHSFRFTLVAPSRLTEENMPQRDRSLLVMSLVFDGDERDVLTVLYEKMLPDLEEVLQHVRGFAGTSTAEQFQRFVLERRVRSGFFFRDIGLLGKEDQRLDLTRMEMEGAVALRTEFLRFYAKHRTDAPDALRAAFDDFRRQNGLGLSLPLSNFETRRPDEHRWIRRIVELTARLQDRDARADAQGRKRRVAHTKHHGFMTATLSVESNLDPRYAKGLFAAPGTYAAVLRTSNTTDTRRPDSDRDGRGVALKVFDVGSLSDAVIQPQPEKRPRPCDDALGVAQSSPGAISQDFLLIANPTFFCEDVREFAVFRSLLDVQVPYRWLGIAVLALRNLRKVDILRRTIRKAPNHPFELTYHSMTPYGLGDDAVVKYILEARDPRHFATFKAPPGTDNPLGLALQKSLEDESIVLDLYIHAPPPEVVDVEATTRDWDRKKYPRVKVATITIPPQDPTTPARLEQGERTVFNPWNARKEHRPLGSLNRARLAIYEASAEVRRAVSSAEPSAAEEDSPPPETEKSMRLTAPPAPRNAPLSEAPLSGDEGRTNLPQIPRHPPVN